MDAEDGRSRAGESLLNEAGGGPWGGGGSGGSGGSGGGSGGGGDGLGPRNPWNQPPRKRPGRGPAPTALDEFLRRSRGRLPGNLPGNGRSLWGWAALGLLALWLIFTSIHQIGPQQRGVVTRFGRYTGTLLQPGMRLTLPLPFDRVARVNVDEIKTIDIGSTSANSQNLMLTGDQNIVDLAYSARWSIRDPELYLFELKEPEDTIREVAESAMRAEIARVSLNDAIGPQRSAIEGRVQQRMQEILDGYRAGVQVQGIAIKQSDPPAAVVDAFKSVSAAQQAREADLNQARAYAQQLSSKAEGEAAAFDKVYAQYRLSPEVTRRRMYYETMEDVLARTDKVVVETPGVAPLLPLPGAAKPKAPAAEAPR